MLFLISGCAGWTINGIPSEQFKDMSVRDAVEFSAGIIASGFMHTAGHAGYLELSGTKYHLDGNYERIDEPISNAHAANIGRAGPLLQLAGGLLLEWLDKPRLKWFESGYDSWTAFNLTTYPWAVNEDGMGDIEMIRRNIGNAAEAEWGLYTAASWWLLIDKEIR